MRMPCHITDGWPRTPEGAHCGSGIYLCDICDRKLTGDDYRAARWGEQEENLCERCRAEIFAEENGLDTGMKP